MGSEVTTSVVVGGRGSEVGISAPEVIAVGSEVITFAVVEGSGSDVWIPAPEVIAVGSEVRSCLGKFATDVISAGSGVTITTPVEGSGSVVGPGISRTLVTSGTGVLPAAVLSCRASLR